ncbi:hypothetical protein E4U42_000735 [Claviceps africana]|uniref:Uncharacterized protein n=1 Tax=Claviceps africana TaxID=83212 RepID=A0A8K0J9R3_9HYPO|nr:hypothetical protein E4U42_000735 [Claviceps africana]
MSINGTPEQHSIYLGLYSRPNTSTYHWGLVLTDDTVPKLHHVNNDEGGWKYHVKAIAPNESKNLIALISLGRMNNVSRVIEAMKSVPTDGRSSRTREESNCVTWVKDVLMLLHQEGELTLATDIDNLEAQAKSFADTFADLAESGGGATIITEERLRRQLGV